MKGSSQKHKKMIRILVMAGVTLGFCFSSAFGSGPEERGKALFHDQTLGNGTSGKSCNSCHLNSEDLLGVGDQRAWNTPGGTFTSLEEAVNACISAALKGKPLNPTSDQMKDLIAYLKSLKPRPAGAQKKH